MPSNGTMRIAAMLSLLTAVLGSRSAVARDYVLTIGGGYSPLGNQVSLEKNVLFFQRVLDEQKPRGVSHDIYFSDGDSPGRDLQLDEGQDHVPLAHRRMAQLFGSKKYLGLKYRNHQVPGVRGGSNPDNLQAWFAEVGAKLTSDDRLIVYVTAHGGNCQDKKKPNDTRLFMWQGKSITMSQFVGHLDKLPEGVSVVVVMVQCYSGGFAHLLFREGNAVKGLAAANRCGFYATVHDRPAAGCTSDISEGDYQEYSSFFWAALGGKTRTGSAIERPDYDGDGKISFAEAHAYTILTSDTIDIPIKTSDAFLRVYSRTKDKQQAELITSDAPYEGLLALASKIDRAVLEGLSEKLKLTGTHRTKTAREEAKKIENQRKQLAADRKKKQTREAALKKELQKYLRLKWPELGNVLNPEVTQLLTSRGAEFVEAVDGHPKYSTLVALEREIESLTTKRRDLERRWVKYQRFLRAVENIALSANLSKFADKTTQKRYRQLLKAEQGTL